MSKKAKNPPIKKVRVTTTTITGLKAGEKAPFAQGIAAKCLNNVVFQGSPACKTTLATWVVAAVALDTNLKAQTATRTALALLMAQEPPLQATYDLDAIGFATAVESVTQADVTIAQAMGMPVATAPTSVAANVGVPIQVRIAPLKKTGAPRLTWDHVPRATLYLAQLSVEPATEATYEVLPGSGKTRTLPPLVSGQHYVLRVAATGRNGKQSAWSNTVSILGK